MKRSSRSCLHDASVRDATYQQHTFQDGFFDEGASGTRYKILMIQKGRWAVINVYETANASITVLWPWVCLSILLHLPGTGLSHWPQKQSSTRL